MNEYDITKMHAIDKINVLKRDKNGKCQISYAICCKRYWDSDLFSFFFKEGAFFRNLKQLYAISIWCDNLAFTTLKKFRQKKGKMY